LVSHRASQKVPQEPTKWQKIINDTSNLLTLPLTLRRGRHNPSQSPKVAKNNHQLLPTPLSCSKPSRWWQPLRETKISQQINHQVLTRCNLTMQMHLNHSISLRICKEAREMSGRGVAWLKVLTSMSKNAREIALSRPTSIYIRTPSNRVVRHLKTLQSR
jgi:hypothetical protein